MIRMRTSSSLRLEAGPVAATGGADRIAAAARLTTKLPFGSYILRQGMQPVKRQMGVISPDLRPVDPPAMEPMAGAVSLDFANTANRPDGRTPVDEKLRSYADLAAWAERAGVLGSDGAARLAALASTAHRSLPTGLTTAVWNPISRNSATTTFAWSRW